MAERPRNAATVLDGQGGFSLLELMVAVGLLTLVSASIFSALLNVTKVGGMVSNRSEMHAGVRNATELLQQEVGQAGRIALPGTVTLGTAIVAGTSPQVLVTSVGGMFVGELLVVDTGANEETVAITAIDAGSTKITATFINAHAVGAPIQAAGGFAAGVVPTSPGTTNGSTGTALKIFGDINGDGQMVYVEYSCDTASGNLYRRSVSFTAANKPAINASQSLLNNITANPDGSPCFTYQQMNAGGTTFVVDVAITLTVQTAEKDPITSLKQKETKALLNVSPRNVFNVWQMAGLGISNRVQPTPASVTALLP